MKRAKREKLEKAGWKVGDANEFLGIPKKTKPKKKCQAETPICSNELVRTYGVNGSEKQGETFDICGPCAVMLKKSAKLKQVTNDDEDDRAGEGSASVQDPPRRVSRTRLPGSSQRPNNQLRSAKARGVRRQAGR